MAGLVLVVGTDEKVELAWVLCVGGSSLVVEVQPFDLQNTPFCR